MPPWFYAVSAVGITLECWLLWLLYTRRLLSRFPYFSAFLLCDFLCNLALVVIAAAHQTWFRWSSGAAIAVSTFTGLFIVWEVVRSAFPQGSTLRHLVQGALLGISSIVFPVVLAICWSQANLIHFAYKYLPPSFEQYFCLAEALVLLAIAAVARYYAVPLGRNVSGMLFGFGIYSLCCAMNFAALQTLPGYLPSWQILSSALYMGLLGFWLWAFWIYAPPELASEVQSRLAARSEALWVNNFAVRRGRN